MRSAALRKAEAPHASTVGAWYEGHPVLVPAIKLAAGNAAVCPFCSKGVHVHGADGLHNPPCNGTRARYLIRGLAPAEFVRLMLHRLGFEAEQLQQIMDEIAGR
jgi:hypothetical protein